MPFKVCVVAGAQDKIRVLINRQNGSHAGGGVNPILSVPMADSTIASIKGEASAGH